MATRIVSIFVVTMAGSLVCTLTGPSQAAALVGVDLDQDLNHPTNWTLQDRYLPPLTLNDLVGEDGIATSVDLTLSGAVGDDFPISIIASTLPMHDQSLAGLDGGLTFPIEAGPTTITATWGDLNALAMYEVYVFSLADVPDELNVPVALEINSQPGDSNRTLRSYAESIQASAAGEIVLVMPGPLFPSGNELAGLAIRLVPEPTSLVLVSLGLIELVGAVRRKGISECGLR